MKDAFGNELELGDHIGTITSSDAVIKGEIIKFGKNQIKIEVLSSDRWKVTAGETKWVPQHRAMKLVQP